MAVTRSQFIFRLHVIGIASAAALALAGGGLLLSCAPSDSSICLTHPAVWGFLVLLGLGIAIAELLVRLLLNRVLKPTGKVAAVASRVSQGDLSTPEWANRRDLDGLSTTIVGMVTKLQDLVGTIRQHSHDASAMAQEIAASTQQMTASTQEV